MIDQPLAEIDQPLAEAPDSPVIVQEERPDPDRPHWGPLAGLGVWFFSVAAIIVVPVIALILWYVLEQVRGAKLPITPEELIEWAGTPNVLLVQIISTGAAHLLTLAVCWAVVTRMGRRPFLETVGWRWSGGTPVSKFIFIVGVVGLSIAVNVVLAQFLPQSEETIFDKLLKSSQQVRVAVAILAVVSAPLVEEAVYRGVLFSSLRSRLGLGATVVIVTTLFASLHFIQYWGAWAGLAGLTVFSLVLTMIRAKTKSLFPCVAAHLLYNSVGAISILLQKNPTQ